MREAVVISETMKKRANYIRRFFIEDMARHLLAFESKLTEKHTEVKWIPDETVLVQTMLDNLPKEHFNRYCFDLKLVPAALKSHPAIKMVAPADVENDTDTAETLFIEANWGIVETGELVFVDKITQNCFNKVNHIVVLLDIDKLVVKASDLEILLYMQSSHHSRNLMPFDTKIVNTTFQQVVQQDGSFGMPTQASLQDVKFSVYLYDNGITDILANPTMRQTLYCIHCGRCQSVCPVYAVTHKFSPIDLVRNGFYNDEKGDTVNENTSFCGNCRNVCPVMIPLTDLMLEQLEQKKYHQRASRWLKDFGKRNKMNKLNKWPWRNLFIRRYYGANRMLADYFKQKTEDFFNLWQTPKDEDE